MHPYLRYAVEKQGEISRLIKRLVECESPSDSSVDVDRVVDVLIEETSDIASAQVVRPDGFGEHLRLEFAGAGQKAGQQILALGHSDTVWPLGTLSRMPFRELDGRLWGPGVLDMKSGLAFFIYAMRALRESGDSLECPVVLLVVSDEEVGSPTSRYLTEEEAKQSRAVLVLEPGTGLTGKLKTARKGVGRYVITISGQAAHAGVDFSNGASAILEAAHQIQKIAKMTDLLVGTTVNPGVVHGGTKSNVIAAEATIEVDVRSVTLTEGIEVDRALHTLRPADSRCSIHVEGGLNRPPMERTARIAQMLDLAQQVGRESGVTIEESSTGGGSDGNFTAALGVPTLDGLGAVGEGAHAPNESILIDRIPDRVALLAGLIKRLGTGLA